MRWAQRSSESEHEKNIVYLTVVTPDIVDPKIDIQPKSVDISGSDKHGKAYKLHLDLFDEIEPEATKQRHNDLNLFFVLQKKQDKLDFWPRLAAGKDKLHNVRTDFDKWVDEDEQDEAGDAELGPGGGMGDMASMMGGMGGAGGMGGLDFSKLVSETLVSSHDKNTTDNGSQAGMGGAGGDMDFSSMMAGMGGGAGGAAGDFGGADSDDDDADAQEAADATPKLEEVTDK